MSQERSIKVTFRTNIADFKQQLKSASTSLEDLAAKGDKTGKVAQTHLGRLAQSAQLQREAWSTVSTGLATYGAVATATVGAVVKKFADFDEAMSAVQASTHESAANMELLRAAAIDAGADTQYSATEAAGAIEELAKAGITTSDILNGGLAGSLDLAAAGGLSVADAAGIASIALTQFKLQGKDVGHVADLLAAGAGKAMGDVTDLGMALKQSGLVASQTGLSIEETTGALSAFASAGLLGSDAGTSFKSMLQRLTPQSQEAQTLMDELGISAYDAQGNFVGLASFAGNLQDSLKGLTTEQRNSTLATIFGSDAVRAASVLYDQGADGIQEWIDKVNDSGYAAETAAARTDNLKGDIERLSGSLESVFIKAGSGANDVLRWLVQTVESAVDAFGNLPPFMQQGTIGLLALSGATAGVVGIGMKMLTWTTDSATKLMDLGVISGETGGKLGKLAGKTALATAGLTAFFATLQGVQWATQAVAGIDRVTLGVEELQNGLTAAAAAGDSFYGAIVTPIGNINTQQFSNLGETLDRIANPGWADTLASVTHLDATGFNDVVKQFDVLNDQISKLASSDVKSATKQFAGMWKEAGGSAQALENLKKVLPGYVEQMYALANNQGLVIDSSNELDLLTGKLNGELITTSDAADATSSAIDSVTDSAESATDAMDEYVQSLNDAAGVQLSLSDAQMQWEAAIDSATDALTENGQTLDITTEAGRNNRAALDDMASSAWDLVTSLYEVDGASADLEGTMQTARNAFIQTAIQMGMTQAEAEELADKYGLIPSNVRTTVEASDNASGTIAWIKQQLIELPNHKTITVETRQIGRVGVGMAASTYAVGGAVSGPGTATSDSILARLSNGEHVLTASDVQKIGGQSAVYRLRAAIQAGMVRFADGGAVGGSSLVSPKVMVSTTPTIYVQNPFTGKYLLAQVDQRAENVAVDVVNAR